MVFVSTNRIGLREYRNSKQQNLNDFCLSLCREFFNASRTCVVRIIQCISDVDVDVIEFIIFLFHFVHLRACAHWPFLHRLVSSSFAAASSPCTAVCRCDWIIAHINTNVNVLIRENIRENLLKSDKCLQKLMRTQEYAINLHVIFSFSHVVPLIWQQLTQKPKHTLLSSIYFRESNATDHRYLKIHLYNITSFTTEHFTHLPSFFSRFIWRILPSVYICLWNPRESRCFVRPKSKLKIILIVILLFWSFQEKTTIKQLSDQYVRKMSSCSHHWSREYMLKTCECEHASERSTVSGGLTLFAVTYTKRERESERTAHFIEYFYGKNRHVESTMLTMHGRARFCVRFYVCMSYVGISSAFVRFNL